MAGRPPKPTHLKVLEGNPGKRALNKHEPKPAVKVPSCPRHLVGEAKKEWRRISRELITLNLLTEVDRAALAAYCQAWARWVYAEERIARLIELEAQAKSQAGELVEKAKAQLQALASESAYLKELGMMGASEKIDQRLAEMTAEIATLNSALANVTGVAGLVAVTDKGYSHATPWIQISNLAVKQMKAFLTEFGMTPASRTRVVVPKAEEADPYEEFRKRKTS